MTGYSTGKEMMDVFHHFPTKETKRMVRTELEKPYEEAMSPLSVRQYIRKMKNSFAVL